MKILRSLTGVQAHLFLGWALVLLTLGAVCFLVPPEIPSPTMKDNYLIFFYHFPSAMSCLLFFLIAGGISAYQLATDSTAADRSAASAVEIGVLACTITLASGSTWARAAWGTWWKWDDKRLLTVAVMWLLYIGYLAFRGVIESPSAKARFSSVCGVLFALNVPLVYYAIAIFGRVSHPDPRGDEGFQLIGMEAKSTQWFGFLAFFILYLALWRLRYRAHRVANETERLTEAFQNEGI